MKLDADGVLPVSLRFRHMARLKILQYPDQRLRTVATAVPAIDNDIRRLVGDMAQTMYAANGIGLAATQVDVHQRIVIADVSEAGDELLVLINPLLIEHGGTAAVDEGCLSLPNAYSKITRAEWVRLRAWDLNGVERHILADGTLAMCLQHELDHLDGILFIDHLSERDRKRLLGGRTERKR